MLVDLDLPSGETVRYIYLRDVKNLGDMIYLQSIRSGRLKEDYQTSKTYKAMEWLYAIQLSEELDEMTFDAALTPPSSRTDAKPYLEQILATRDAIDFSNRFTRNGKCKSANEHSVKEMLSEFIYQKSGDECKIGSLLIVDDSVASGTTIATIIQLLKDNGMRDTCKVTVASPAWLKAKPTNKPHRLFDQ